MYVHYDYGRWCNAIFDIDIGHFRLLFDSLHVLNDFMQESGFNLTTLSYTHHHRGFHVKFSNGYTVSVQFGPNSISSIGSMGSDEFVTPANIDNFAENAEIAVISPDNKVIPFRGDGEYNKGYVSPDELVGIFTWVMRRGQENEANNPS